MTKELSDIHQRLTDVRTEGDYDDFVIISKSDVEELMGLTKKLSAVIKSTSIGKEA